MPLRLAGVRHLRATPDTYSSELCPAHAVTHCRCSGGRGAKRLPRALQDGDVLDTDTARKGTLTYYQWCALRLVRAAWKQGHRAPCGLQTRPGAAPVALQRGRRSGGHAYCMAPLSDLSCQLQGRRQPAALPWPRSGAPAWRERAQRGRQRCAGCAPRPLASRAGAPGVPRRQVRRRAAGARAQGAAAAPPGGGDRVQESHVPHRAGRQGRAVAQGRRGAAAHPALLPRGGGVGPPSKAMAVWELGLHGS